MDDGKELSEIDRALVEALDVDVSPDFAARVRQRIVSEPVRVPFWRGWRIAVPAAAAAVLIVAAGVAVWPKDGRSALPSLAARPIAVDPLRPVDVRPASAALAPDVRQARGVAAPPRVASAHAEPEVLVPHEEIEMYRRLLALAQTASPGVVLESPKEILASGSIAEIAVDPIKAIDLIKIELIAPPIGGEGERQ